MNSRHHQGIKNVGDGLKVTATAPDGVVECIESSKDDQIVAVQWHPENMEEKVMDPLFKAFAERVKRWMV